MTTAYESGNVPRIEVKHRLRIARESAGLEQDELAQLIGVSRNTVGNAEKGRGSNPPRRIMVNAWALACGVPVSWILTGEEPTEPRTPDGGGGSDPHSADYKTVVCAFPVRKTMDHAWPATQWAVSIRKTMTEAAEFWDQSPRPSVIRTYSAAG